MPLDWAQPDGSSIDIAVKRHLGSARGRHRQIWLVAGGPGQAGVGLEPLAQKWSQLDPAADFYIPDHRGTGLSTRLTCPQTEGITSTNPLGNYNFDSPMPPNLWASCIQEIAKSNPANDPQYLSHFTVTNAAKDLAQLISISQQSGQEVDVVAVSYGTFLAQRYLQLAPRQAAKVILAGVGILGSYSASHWDLNHNDIGQKIFATCGTDGYCSSRLGKGDAPWAALGALLSQLQAQPDHCETDAPDGKGGVLHNVPISYAKLRGMLALYVDVAGLRDTLPALVNRIARCNDTDKAALAVFRANFFQNATGGEVGGVNYSALTSSEVLQNVVISSEETTLPSDTSPAGIRAYMKDLVTQDAALYFSAAFGPLFGGYFAFGLRDSSGNAIPIYARDRYYGVYPNPAHPMLLLNGTLDPSTPIAGAQEVASHYQGPRQYFFPVPNAGHATFGFDAGEKPNCAMRIVQQFLADAKPDSSCLANQPGLDFQHQGDGTAQKLFGRDDLWD